MKTRVLYLDHTSKLGGAEFALLRFLKAIDLAVVDPVILFADEGPAPQLFRDAGFETHVLPLSGKVREVRKDTLGGGAFLHPGRAMALLGYAARVARFAKQQRIDIIHTNSMKAHFYGGAAGRLAGLPVVWHVRDFINTSYLPGAAVHVVRLLAKIIPSYVITVSQSVMDQLHLESGNQPDPMKRSVVLDGLTDEELREADDLRNGRAATPDDEWRLPVRVGIVGRLASWKGQHILLDAAAKLLKAGHNARFLIIGAPLFGEDDYEEELRRQADALGIAPQVEFLGFRKDVPALLSELDILVHASTSADPCPNTILEGMAHGLPVIGSNGGGVPELIVDGETGLLAPMGDSDGLARVLDGLLRDPRRARELARAGYGRVRNHFTVTRVARQVEEVYRRMLVAHKPRSQAAATGLEPAL
jgi:glycosyltransferase involved in cell wall biosynthesis